MRMLRINFELRAGLKLVLLREECHSQPPNEPLASVAVSWTVQLSPSRTQLAEDLAGAAPDAILFEHRKAAGTGAEMLRRPKAKCPNIPTIAVVTGETPVAVRLALAAGTNAILLSNRRPPRE